MTGSVEEILRLLAQCDALLNDAIVWNDMTSALYEERSELQSRLKRLARRDVQESFYL